MNCSLRTLSIDSIMSMPTLQLTNRFQVWNLAASAEKVAGVTDKQHVHVGGGKRITLAEVYKVGAENAALILDDGTLEKMDDLMKAKGQEPLSFDCSQKGFSTSSYLPKEICRAATFAFICTCMREHAVVSSSVVEHLAELLASGVCPCFTDFVGAAAKDSIIGALVGSECTACYTPSGIVTAAAALASVDLSSCKVTVADAESLRLCNSALYCGASAFVGSFVARISI